MASVGLNTASLRRRQGRRRGFSLIEMMIVVTVAGFMLMIAVPYLRVSPRRHVSGAAQQVIRFLEHARTRAMSSKKAVRIAFDLANNGYVGFVDFDDDGNIEEKIEEARALGSGVKELGAFVVFGRGTAPELTGFPGPDPVTFTNERLDFDIRGLTAPFGTRGVIYLQHVDDYNTVAAISVTGSASLKLWHYKDGAWQ